MYRKGARWGRRSGRGPRPHPDGLQADLVAHGGAQTLGALLGHALRHRDGRDAAGLRADDVGHALGHAPPQRVVQDELGDLGGLTAARGTRQG